MDDSMLLWELLHNKTLLVIHLIINTYVKNKYAYMYTGNGVTSPAMGTGLESDIEDQNTPAEIEMENQADENQQQDGGTSLGDANVEQTSSQEKQQRMSLEENTGTKETQVQRKHELSKCVKILSMKRQINDASM